jgi:hypothetical protein
MQATAAMKRTVGSIKSVLPTDMPSIGVGLLLTAAARLYSNASIADRLPTLANLVISNVPGPPFPLYMAGARMLTNYPTSIVMHGVALNITVQSYDQSLDFGLIACAKACPHLDELAADLRAAYEEFIALDVEPLPAAAPRTRPRAARRGAARAAEPAGDAGKKIARRSPAGAKATARARS